jgi:hypothetical protein
MAERARLREENYRLMEALTPSASTKAAYMSKFSFRHIDHRVNIPWVAIKDIMAAIRARTALKEEV